MNDRAHSPSRAGALVTGVEEIYDVVAKIAITAQLRHRLIAVDRFAGMGAFMVLTCHVRRDYFVE